METGPLFIALLGDIGKEYDKVAHIFCAVVTNMI